MPVMSTWGAAFVGVLASAACNQDPPSATTISIDEISSVASVQPGRDVTLTAAVSYSGTGTLTFQWSA